MCRSKFVFSNLTECEKNKDIEYRKLIKENGLSLNMEAVVIKLTGSGG